MSLTCVFVLDTQLCNMPEFYMPVVFKSFGDEYLYMPDAWGDSFVKCKKIQWTQVISNIEV